MSMSVGRITGTPSIPSVAQTTRTEAGSGESFQKILDDAAGSVNKLQVEADSSAAKLAAGEPVELHEVLLATERASIAFQFAVQVRNKVVEAYQEIMRMQV